MPAPVFAAGSTALITGAASGVGLAVAQLCRRHGMKLALVDNNSGNLALAKKTLGSAAQTETYDMDVSKIEQWEALKGKVSGTFGGVEMLVLNAGMSAPPSWDDNAYFRKVLETNLFGVVNGLTTFLPLVRASAKPSAVVLTGSKQGITNPPGNPAYNASKAAVKSLAEGLSYELRASRTAVHLLVPGWTFTGLSGGGPAPSKDKPAGAWAPEQVADFLEKKMEQGQFWVVCPDNDVDEDTDRRRMLWTGGDAVFGRKPLSRWRDEYKDEAERTMKGFQV